jgi:hypothetical protein
MDDDQALRTGRDAQLTPSLCRRKQPFYFTTLKKKNSSQGLASDLKSVIGTNTNNTNEQ